ncbi:B12-binding domain-containing radical SAM protein [Candidatus Poribacteria bacterium]|nr:B12-binding domain-containing radical SAM protein [Candidatus Poribacteria bacterium]
MKVIFFYPSYRDKIGRKDRVEFPPLGMLSICAVLEDLGCEVGVFPLDMETNVDSLPEAEIYAYTITATVTYPIFLSKVPKLKNKAEIHIAGNTHASIFPKEVLNELKLNVVFCGEAEIAIRDWFNNGLKQYGIIQGGRVNINEIPFPARHLLPPEQIYLNYRIGGKYNNVISMFSSRGCIHKCSFCAVQCRGSVRFRTPQNFKSELQQILNNYHLCEGLVLLDSNFTISKQHAINISKTIKEFNLPWECNSRPDTLTGEIIHELVNSNCQEIKLGIETGSQRLLEMMHKDINLLRTKQIIKLAFDLGLPVKLYIMHGFPGENMSTTKETIAYLSELRPYIYRIGLYRFAPMPGSEVYTNPEIRKLDWSQYTIYENNNHWFGKIEDFEEIEESFQLLREFVDKNF